MGRNTFGGVGVGGVLYSFYPSFLLVLYKCSSVHLAVQDNAMLTYIRNKTAVPYFSNLVWFIGNNVLNLNTAVKHDVE